MNFILFDLFENIHFVRNIRKEEGFFLIIKMKNNLNLLIDDFLIADFISFVLGGISGEFD